MNLGFDIDNTIINYSPCLNWVVQTYFPDHSDLLECIGSDSRVRIRSVCKLPHKNLEKTWQDIQSLIYGPEIERASIFNGFTDSLAALREEDANRFFLVSHKTKYASRDINQFYDLRKACICFLESQGIVGKKGPITIENIFFCDSLSAKVKMIEELRIDYFVDDLTSVLLHPSFPTRTKGILFDPNENAYGDHCNERVLSRWSKVELQKLGMLNA